MVDWASTGSMLSGIGTLCGSIAVGLAAFVGRTTFNDWRRQRVEERRIDLAEETLALVYQVRRSISKVRNPYAGTAENARARDYIQARRVGEGPPDLSMEDLMSIGYIAAIRLAEEEPRFSELDRVRPRVWVLFGSTAEEQLGVISSVISRIQSAASFLAQPEVLAGRTQAQLDAIWERRNGWHLTIWESTEEDATDGMDAIAREIAGAIKTIEHALAPTLNSGRSEHSRDMAPPVAKSNFTGTNAL